MLPIAVANAQAAFNTPCRRTHIVEYPSLLLDHARAPRHRQRLPDAATSARVSNPLCGDEVVLDVADGMRVGFEATGCALTVGAADLVAEAVAGMGPAQVERLDEEWLHGLIGMVPPPGRRRCASLGLDALKAALSTVDGP